MDHPTANLIGIVGNFPVPHVRMLAFYRPMCPSSTYCHYHLVTAFWLCSLFGPVVLTVHTSAHSRFQKPDRPNIYNFLVDITKLDPLDLSLRFHLSEL